MIGTRARNNVFIIAVVVATLSSILGALPHASAQTPTEQFVCNDRISAQVTADGRLNFGVFPNPADCRAGSGSFPISYTWPFSPTSYTTVRIDGVDQRFEFGTQTTPPTIVNGNSIITEANFG